MLCIDIPLPQNWILTKTEEDGHAQEVLKKLPEGLVQPTVLAESAEVVSPPAGQVKPLSQPDPVFSSGVMEKVSSSNK